MKIYYSRSNDVDDSVMNIHIANFTASLPENIRRNLLLTRHNRGTTYNPQLLDDADLVIVGLKNDTDSVIGKGVHEECMRAFTSGKRVLVFRRDIGDEYIFLQEACEDDLCTISDGTDWKRYSNINLYDQLGAYRKPTLVCKSDESSTLLTFALGDAEETEQYFKMRYPNADAINAYQTGVDMHELLLGVSPSSSCPTGIAPYTKEDTGYLWYAPNGSAPRNDYRYQHGDSLMITLPMYPGLTFKVRVAYDWLSPEDEETIMHKLFTGIGVESERKINNFCTILGYTGNYTMTNLWQGGVFSHATRVINAIERRVLQAGGTFLVFPLRNTTMVNTQDSPSDTFFDLMEKQPETKVSRFMSNEDFKSPLDDNEDLLLLS